jgi:hypothetical protein
VFCLAAAVDLWYRPIRKQALAVGMAGDATADSASNSVHAMLEKLPNQGVPGRPQPPAEHRGGTVLVYSGSQRVPRGDAETTFESLRFQALEISSFTKEQLQNFNFDTCNVMFGTNVGVAVRLQRHCYWWLSRKCESHLTALGDMHGMEANPVVKQTIDNLIQYGKSSDASPKFGVLMAESNEWRGTDTKVTKRASATRWSSDC